MIVLKLRYTTNFINLLGVFCDNIVLLPFTSTHNCQRNKTNQGFSLNDSFFSDLSV